MGVSDLAKQDAAEVRLQLRVRGLWAACADKFLHRVFEGRHAVLNVLQIL